MNAIAVRASLLSVALTGLVLLAAGCNQNSGDAKDTGGKKDKPAEVAKKGGHDHSGWWCDEHGVPEGECSMCSAKAAKEFKAKGDWCEKHDRAKSQCFICDPSLKEKYAVQYRAKYGKEPPEPEDQREDQGGKK